MNDKKTSAYRRIVSSTAIFGSAQILNILVNIIRGKLVAYILHSAGMGIASIFTSAANTIQQFALMGLNMSAVPSISQANNDADPQVLAFTIRLVRRIVLLASLLGLIVTVVLSPVLAHTSFNDQSYIPYFILLSLSVFFNVMGTGEMAVMQGLRRYKLLAFCSVVPPLCGLLLSVPIYFIWGIQGIVPAMIVVNLVYFVVIRMLSYRNKQSAPQEHISMKTMWTQGRGIIKFGAIMTFGSLLGTLTTYALIAFISNVGSIEDVGFYQASNVITSQYTGLVFTAMATDYYPHLSSLVKTNMREAFRVINQQTEIIMLIIAPLASILILTAPLAIRILLTEEFLSIERMICFIGFSSRLHHLCQGRQQDHLLGRDGMGLHQDVHHHGRLLLLPRARRSGLWCALRVAGRCGRQPGAHPLALWLPLHPQDHQPHHRHLYHGHHLSAGLTHPLACREIHRHGHHHPRLHHVLRHTAQQAHGVAGHHQPHKKQA